MRKIVFILFLAIITQAQGNLFGNNNFGTHPESVLPSDETLSEITAYNNVQSPPKLRQAPGEEGPAQKEDAIPVGNVDAAIVMTFLLSYGVILLKKRKQKYS